MKSTVGTALALLLASSATAQPPLPPRITATPYSAPAGKATAPCCTTTTTVTMTRLPTPPYWPACSFDGTEHIYPSTQTVYEAVDCHGCDQIIVRETPIVLCPAEIIRTSVVETTPTTTTSTVCATSVY